MWKDWSKLEKIMFEQIEREFADVQEIFSKLTFSTDNLSGGAANDRLPYYYGYQLTVGSDGKPQLREFGNFRHLLGRPADKNRTKEPLVDTVINEKEKTLTLTAEMPGVNKRDIRIKFVDNKIDIDAGKGAKKYQTSIPVSAELDGRTAKAIYLNGILEIKINLKKFIKSEETDIKID